MIVCVTHWLQNHNYLTFSVKCWKTVNSPNLISPNVMHVHTCIHLYTSILVHIYIYIYIYTSTYTYACTHSHSKNYYTVRGNVEINISTQRLLILSTNLDSFTLANLRWFTKLPPHQTVCYQRVYHIVNHQRIMVNITWVHTFKDKTKQTFQCK